MCVCVCVCVCLCVHVCACVCCVRVCVRVCVTTKEAYLILFEYESHTERTAVFIDVR